MTDDRPVIARTRDELAAAYRDAGSARRAVVMTMGALHAGHASLMREARELVGPDGHVTATIFVNPLQFAANEDLAKYPRTFDADVEVCATERVDLIFAPDRQQMYPTGDPAVTVHPGPLGDRFEGSSRPGHFIGVLTVVNKLLHLTGADVALFGEKDYQQLALIQQMARDLELPVQIVGAPIVRDTDGLALSSRNRYLDDSGRDAALAIPRAVEAGIAAARAGGTAVDVVAAADRVLSAEPAVTVDYIVVTDPLMGPPPPSGEARLILTAVVAGTRLLDNARVDLRPIGMTR